MLESACEQCLAYDISRNMIAFEVKSVEKLLPVHEAQLLIYLKLAYIRIGLLINFNGAILKNGIK